MKKILFGVVLCFTHLAFGQDTVFYTAQWNPTVYPKIIKYFGVKEYDENGVGMATYYLKDGTLYSQEMEKNHLNEGEAIWYHPNGKKKEEGSFVEDKRHGVFKYYDENGTLTREVNYRHGNIFIKETVQPPPAIPENLHKDKANDSNDDIIEFPDVDAEFIGGPDSMMKHIQRHIEYPMKAIINNDQGKVYIQFVVELDGSISNVKVQRGVTHELDSAAVAVIKSMPNWKPGEIKGKPCRARCRIPIVFTLAGDDSETIEFEEKKKGRKKRR